MNNRNYKAGVVVGALVGSVRLIGLEAFGLSGAFWGNSDMEGLRNEDNRPLYVTVGNCLLVTSAILTVYLQCGFEVHGPKKSTSLNEGFRDGLTKPIEAIWCNFFIEQKEEEIGLEPQQNVYNLMETPNDQGRNVGKNEKELI